MVRPALFALCLALTTMPAAAQNWREQRTPFDVPARGVDNHGMLPFPKLVGIARGAAGGGTHIGSDYDMQSGLYRFKFINNGRVTWVDVDSRSGDVTNVEGR